ncbi:CoA-acylating methylmalonate-semialdehyde dehydrogenase [Acidocella aminolytica]|jgi:malonate-semialdehyde dehydrogenase (acetylating)/methylmalonate-semialdehyde dehydrogenase|uniref:methylmalonate-semialdehyde dehydrogenase (CoA acylating) n=1 Tax=Acidocella aminolytica 101 = DSM 11237 TaxID=1120923 RepID=A0A0D6PJ54_9PROT|nr:CoA-acylating methylmalonate-semialdehyde dehydrogenase [Acidocella aminolytica]GAN80854.1 aldehyde/methylmalonate-semialdehyde dehydrogenase [Acidocella aminolytica 101 = DSM 11237]GBQ36562.1 aldehyde/methylmalonate-semialdehyde dehydrogenase [Acidocella aminolytica 101 = DSM 11237]SHE31725.1 malonate-semialdehyde dehydrogenase (acetylating) / methylmalonate-semialdehyde dehydrogenase [Acidocella aminolytica 101 = DSM 11237]
METLGHFINGKAVPGAGTRTLAVFNPATGAQSKQVAVATADEVNSAIEAAAAAFPDWAATPPLRRARVMFRFKDLLEQHADELASLISSEHGKVHSDAKGEVTRGLEVVEFACGIPELLKGEFTENVGTNIDSYSVRQALGVCAGITPFNFPAMVPMWMFPMAIACGNTFILKISEKVPSAALRMAELLKQAGLPDGVFNVVNGDKDVVDQLLHDPRIAAVSFVGSTPIAEYVYSTGTKAGKRVQALGGAKNHLVIMPDANLDQAVDALMGAAYGSAGERCMAVSVAVPIGPIAEPLIERITERARALKIGPGTDKEAEMGPLVTAQHKAKVEGYIAKGVEEGATLVLDGRGLKLQGNEDGYFTGPTLFDNVTPDMSIYKEEIFGPVLSVVRQNSFDDALALVNKHEFGNGAVIYTSDGDTARAFSNGVLAGMVGVNVPIPVPMAFHSFGGWKRSIFGDHAIHGREGVRFYTRIKTITSRWPTGIRKGAEFAMPTMK